MSIAVGSTVDWVTLDRATGKPASSVRTSVLAIEDVTTGSGNQIRCAVLSCNRFAPVSQLFPIGDAPAVEKERHVKEPPKMVQRSSTSELDADRWRAGDSTAEVGNNRQSESNGNRSSLSASGHREGHDSIRSKATSSDIPDQRASANATKVVAIDFLNVLVRAWHAGKPTETHAVRSLFQTVANTIRKLKPKHVVFALDGGHAMRSQLLPEYKAHRPDPEPGLQAQKALAEQVLQICGFQAVRVPDWEADDVLASLVCKHPDTVIVSSDKDLLALSGQAERCRIYHPWQDGAFVTAEEKLGVPAGQVTDFLALCGDTSDGIPGVKGCGPKTALQLLKEFDSLEGILTASVTGQIKGAIGQKLKEQHHTAFLCRRVVELNVSLPLPELQPWRPVADWQHRLQELRLGSVAAIVESLLKDPAAISLQNPDAAVTAEPQIEQQTAEPSAWMITQHSAGRSYRGTTTENPWRRDSDQYLAWQQGFEGLPLDLTRRPAIAAKPKGLFGDDDE